jgi:pyruvate, water dikinase
VVTSTPRVLPLSELRSGDTALVGGKNASLGELLSQLRVAGIQVPDGFATTASAFREFVEENDLTGPLATHLDHLHRGAPLATVGAQIRGLLLAAPLPEPLARAVVAAYRELAIAAGVPEPPVAVRSSATAEDLPEASFAGQQESFLNVVGEAALLEACRRC